MRIDLTDGKITKEEIDDDTCRLFVGGAGIDGESGIAVAVTVGVGAGVTGVPRTVAVRVALARIGIGRAVVVGAGVGGEAGITIAVAIDVRAGIAGVAGAVGIAVEVMVLVRMVVLMAQDRGYQVVERQRQVHLVEDVVV